MSLKSLIASLQTIPDNMKEKTGKELASKSLHFSPHWEKSETEIHEAVWHKPSDYNLRFNSTFEETYRSLVSKDSHAILSGLLAQIKKMSLPANAFELKSHLRWSPTAFLKEKNLDCVTEVEARGSYSVCDPGRTRIGYTRVDHRITGKLERHRITISASNEYSSLIRPIIDKLKPQMANVVLTEEDAKRWISKCSGKQQERLAHLLKPKDQTVLSLSSYGGANVHSTQRIEIKIATRLLESVSQAIGRPIINRGSSEGSYVASFEKYFFFKRTGLKLLQQLTGMINDHTTTTVFDCPVLSTEQAKALLQKEINAVVNSYHEYYAFGANTHMARGPLVMRLAKEYFGPEIIVAHDSMSSPVFLEYLQARGFKHDVENDWKPENFEKLKEGGLYSSMQQYRDRSPEYQIKEKDLLLFFCQSYVADPKDMVEKFRLSYVNKPPIVAVTGEIKIDASRARAMNIPSQAALMELSLKESTREADNELKIDLSGGVMNLWVRVSITSPKIIDFQDDVCRKFGVTFT